MFLCNHSEDIEICLPKNKKKELVSCCSAAITNGHVGLEAGFFRNVRVICNRSK